MEAKVDQVGRVVLPKALRERLGLTAGATVDISAYGDGIFVVPSGRTARVVDEDGRLVAISDTEISDDDVLGLVEAIRR